MRGNLSSCSHLGLIRKGYDMDTQEKLKVSCPCELIVVKIIFNIYLKERENT